MSLFAAVSVSASGMSAQRARTERPVDPAAARFSSLFKAESDPIGHAATMPTWDYNAALQNPTFQMALANGQYQPTSVPTLDSRIASDMALYNSPFTNNPAYLADQPRQLAMMRAGNPQIYDQNAELTPIQQTIRLYQGLYPKSPEGGVPTSDLDAKYNFPGIPNNVAPNSSVQTQRFVSGQNIHRSGRSPVGAGIAATEYPSRARLVRRHPLTSL